MITTAQTGRIRWRPREPVSARKLNRMIEPENARHGVRPARSVDMTPGGILLDPELLKPHTFIVAVSPDADDAPGDYLICRKLRSTMTEYDPVYVAKPWELRQTPFDGITRAGITYNYQSPVERIASRTVAYIELIEREIVIPVYLADNSRPPEEIGDQILAVYKPVGGTGVTRMTAGEEPEEVPVDWLALTGNRAWTRTYDTDIQ